MAKDEFKAEVYILIDGERHLWYEVDQDKNVVWHLPPDMNAKEKILENIGKRMSRYCMANPQATILQV